MDNGRTNQRFFDIVNSRKNRTGIHIPPPGSHALPDIGLLRRTFIHSSHVKWVFSARIRHSRLNDAVFVGENFVHIKLIGMQGVTMQNQNRMIHVGTKSDFPSNIRAVNVVGKPIEVGFGLPPDRANRPLEKEPFPPNMLVLSLENGDVVFLIAASELHRGRLIFYQSTLPLLRTVCALQPGAQIAVDTRCNVVAFSAPHGQVMLWKLKEWDELAKDFAAGSDTWCPVRHDRQLLSEPGDFEITKLAFLKPTEEGDSISLLALISNVGGRSKLSCWQGDLFQNSRGDLVQDPRQLPPFIREFPLPSLPATDNQGILNGENATVRRTRPN
jgi:hypothetical protein